MERNELGSDGDRDLLQLPDIGKFIATVRKRFNVSAEESRLLREKMRETAEIQAGGYLVREGERIHYSSLILEGFACRCKTSADGDRQIMEIQIPGDFVDLHSYPLEVLDHDICALSDCTIVKFPHEYITALIEESPRLGRILWFSTMVDASIHREWIVNIGSRSGKARIAHLLCELYCRSEVVGMAQNYSFILPLNQTQIGECLGFTQMHVNRMLKELREDGLATISAHRVRIQDWDGLSELAQFTDDYLYLKKRTA